jgi:hypothetical protein
MKENVMKPPKKDKPRRRWLPPGSAIIIENVGDDWKFTVSANGIDKIKSFPTLFSSPKEANREACLALCKRGVGKIKIVYTKKYKHFAYIWRPDFGTDQIIIPLCASHNFNYSTLRMERTASKNLAFCGTCKNAERTIMAFIKN